METIDLISLLQIFVARCDGYRLPAAPAPWLLTGNVLPLAVTFTEWGGPINLWGGSGLETFCVVAAGTLALLSEAFACHGVSWKH